MAQPQVYEGTAEEIAEQLRASNLSGRLKAIVTPEELSTQNGNGLRLSDALADFLAEMEQVEGSAGKPRVSARGKYAGILSTERFLREKQEEIEMEERKFGR